MSAQDRTLDQYHEWMRINAVSHLIRAAREVGLIDALRHGQQTITQLCESLSLRPEPARLLLDALVSIGIIEQYQDDLALSRAAQLLCQYDADLGDQRWQKVAASVRADGNQVARDDQSYFDHLAATQWIHTPAAIQAAEILDIGGAGEVVGPSILDLGCGSAVWSCAMAHRDPAATITAVDHAGAIEAARSTAASIDLTDRFHTITAEPGEVELPEHQFDIVLLAQRLHVLDSEAALGMLRRAVAACKPNGRVVVIDLFRGPASPDLAEAVEALKLDLETQAGQMRSLAESQAAFQAAGLADIQFTFLAASRVNLGLMVGVKRA
jgi:ubiquinone/menaquinone biosynthesis C-methylase UbiE